MLELDDGEVLPQRDFVHYDREADEMDAHGVRPCMPPSCAAALCSSWQNMLLVKALMTALHCWNGSEKLHAMRPCEWHARGCASRMQRSARANVGHCGTSDA